MLGCGKVHSAEDWLLINRSVSQYTLRRGCVRPMSSCSDHDTLQDLMAAPWRSSPCDSGPSPSQLRALREERAKCATTMRFVFQGDGANPQAHCRRTSHKFKPPRVRRGSLPRRKRRSWSMRPRRTFWRRRQRHRPENDMFRTRALSMNNCQREL